MKMVKGKRPVLALLLALCMIVMLLPATVFAEGENGAAEATNNPSGEEVLAGGTTNDGAGDQTVGAAAKDALDKPEGAAAKNVADKPEGTAAKGVATRGVTDQPGEGEIARPYKHTYHTKVISKFTIHYQGQSAQEPESITLESGFNEGNISDPAIQGIIANQKQEMKNKIRSGYVVKDRDILQRGDSKPIFDHFESSNIIDSNPDGDGSVNKNLDVHEYQNYTINYDVYASLDVAEMTPTEEIAPEPANTDPGKDSNTAAKTESKGKKTDSLAKTGDDGNPMLWAGILLLAAAGAGTAVFYRRKADH